MDKTKQTGATKGRRDPAPTEARTALLDRLHAEPVVKVGRWTRDELYADAP